MVPSLRDAGPYGSEPARLELSRGSHAPVSNGLGQIGFQVLQELADGGPECRDWELDRDGLGLLFASELEKRLFNREQLMLVEPRCSTFLVHQSNPSRVGRRGLLNNSSYLSPTAPEARVSRAKLP